MKQWLEAEANTLRTTVQRLEQLAAEGRVGLGAELLRAQDRLAWVEGELQRAESCQKKPTSSKLTGKAKALIGTAVVAALGLYWWGR